MLPLSDKKVVVIGGSRGVGRQVAIDAVAGGAHVLAVARRLEPLQQLAAEHPGIDIFPFDATDPDAPGLVFELLDPDVLVICAGVFPPAAPIHEMTWDEFSVNWQNDVRIAFNFCRGALRAPLRRGASVVLISSGAGLNGSPNSGGYAGSKRTQIFMANYSQKESDRLGLGIGFTALAPRMMPETDLGRHAVNGYARYLGITPEDFVKGMASPPNPSTVSAAILELVGRAEAPAGVFVVSGKGLEPVS